MPNNNNESAEINDAWIPELFKKKKPVFITQAPKKTDADSKHNKLGAISELWISNLFKVIIHTPIRIPYLNSIT